MPKGLTTPLYSLGAKLSGVCAGPGQPLISSAVVTFLSLSKSYWRQTLVSSLREICCCLHLNLSLWVTNEGREVNSRDITLYLAISCVFFSIYFCQEMFPLELGSIASPSSPKDKFVVNVINPCLAEVKK